MHLAEGVQLFAFLCPGGESRFELRLAFQMLLAQNGEVFPLWLGEISFDPSDIRFEREYMLLSLSELAFHDSDPLADLARGERRSVGQR